MKKVIRLSALIIVVLTFVSNISLAQTAEIVIHTTAQCSDCKKAIEKALMAEKGVKFAELNSETKDVKVVYNSKKTNPETLRKAITLVGYDADDMPADSAAVSRLKPCCTKDGHKDH